MSAFISSAVDRLLQLKLGSIALFLSPGGEAGAGVIYMLLPLALLLFPTALFFNDSRKRLFYLERTMLLKAGLALLLSLDVTRQFLSQDAARVGYSLSLIFLAGEWTVICVVLYLCQTAARPLIYLSTLAAAYFMGQSLALALAPHVVSQPLANTFPALCSALYMVAYAAARRCKNVSLSSPFSALPQHLQQAPQHLPQVPQHLQQAPQHLPQVPQHMPQAQQQAQLQVQLHPELFSNIEAVHNHKGTPSLRLLAASVLLYMPLYVPVLLSLFFALQGYQTGTMSFAQLASKAALAFAVGACGSLFLHHLASRRIVLQMTAFFTLALSAAGGLTYSYDLAFFTVMTVSLIAGFITPDWENHLLSILPSQTLAPFMAARNTLVLAAIALLSPTIEKSLSAVSALYVLKEFNLLIFSSAILAIVVAPLLLVNRRPGQDLRSHNFHLNAPQLNDHRSDNMLSLNMSSHDIGLHDTRLHDQEGYDNRPHGLLSHELGIQDRPQEIRERV